MINEKYISDYFGLRENQYESVAIKGGRIVQRLTNDKVQPSDVKVFGRKAIQHYSVNGVSKVTMLSTGLQMHVLTKNCKS